MPENISSSGSQSNANVLGSIETDPKIPDSNVSDVQEERVVLGVEVTDTEVLRLHELGQEIQRTNITRLNDFLARMLTLETAFLGGLFALLKSGPFPLWTAATMLTLLAISMAISLYGLAPLKINDDIRYTHVIAKVEKDAIDRKLFCIKASAAMYAMAILIGIIYGTVNQLS